MKLLGHSAWRPMIKERRCVSEKLDSYLLTWCSTFPKILTPILTVFFRKIKTHEIVVRGKGIKTGKDVKLQLY